MKEAEYYKIYFKGKKEKQCIQVLKNVIELEWIKDLDIELTHCPFACSFRNEKCYWHDGTSMSWQKKN